MLTWMQTDFLGFLMQLHGPGSYWNQHCCGDYQDQAGFLGFSHYISHCTPFYVSQDYLNRRNVVHILCTSMAGYQCAQHCESQVTRGMGNLLHKFCI